MDRPNDKVTVARIPNQNKGGPSRDILTILLVFVSVVFFVVVVVLSLRLIING